jgi:ABC-type nitrate/sulfonate/bicarbonate transport system permease component
MARSGGTGGGKGRAAKPARSSLRRHFESALPTLLVVASIILFWEFFNVITGEPEYVLPPLHKILATVVDRAGDRFLPASWVTLQEMLLGFAFGVGSGAVLGTLIFHFKTMRRALLPMVISTQAVPVIAIAPLLIMWFGFGMAPKVIVVALVTFFPVAVNTISGLASVERETINLMHSFGANQRKIFFMVRFPAALPFIFAGIKNAAAISAIGAIVGEWVGAHEGLGPVMIAANAGFKTDVVFAAIFYLAFMAIALFLAVGVVERLAIPWHFMNRSRK